MTQRIPLQRALLAALCAQAFVGSPSALAAEDDALDLEADKPVPTAGAAPGTAAGATKAPALRLSVELAALQGRTADTGAGATNDNGHRASVDLRLNQALGAGWRSGLSARYDDIRPVQAGQPKGRFQLREAMVGWQTAEGTAGLDIGRINARQGAGYGFNPIDPFRSGATPLITTADPVAVRQGRLGTFMVKGSGLWDGGSAALAWAPKLSSRAPENKTWGLDAAATNGRDRWLLTGQTRLSPEVSVEGMALIDRQQGHRVGGSATALVGESLVVHGDWSIGRGRSMLDTLQGLATPRQQQQQAAAGLTWTLPGGLSLTAEAQFNRRGLDSQQSAQLHALPAATIATFYGQAQADQELASRHAWLLYAKQVGFAGIKPLDVTALVRQNTVDDSLLAWAEVRYHWSRIDLALQWQQSSRKAGTEFGSLPYSRVVQLLGTAYF